MASLRCGTLFVLCALVGCVSSSRPLKPKLVEQQEVADIPVPRLFTFDKEGSYVYTDSFRSAEMVYHGPGWLRGDKVRTFYTSLMPQAAWSYVRSEGPDHRTMIFRKGDEECQIHTRPARSDEGVELVIQLRPRA